MSPASPPAGESALPAEAAGERPRAGIVAFVASPIGNLGDLSHRAVECLRDADLIACEDTRHSRRLLEHYEIAAPKLISLHDRNEASRSREIVERAQQGECIACLSDAGMPAISDPGYRLMRACIDAGVEIDVLPGPSAVLNALVGSGLPTDAFCFEGFLPHKSGRRETMLRAALDRSATTILFESPHRIARTLAQLADLDPDRPICVARELTKKFQTWHRGGATELARAFADDGCAPARGEITLVIAGQSRQQQREQAREVRRREQRSRSRD